MQQLDNGSNMWTWPLTSPMTLTSTFLRSNLKITPCQELWVWLLWNEREANRLDAMWPFLFKTPESLTIIFPRSNFQIAWSQELEGQLKWDQRYLNQSFMTMIVTFVWTWWGGWMYRIVTYVTSNVGMPLTHLVLLVILIKWNFRF